MYIYLIWEQNFGTSFSVYVIIIKKKNLLWSLLLCLLLFFFLKQFSPQKQMNWIDSMD